MPIHARNHDAYTHLVYVRTDKSFRRVRSSHLASLRHVRVLSHFNTLQGQGQRGWWASLGGGGLGEALSAAAASDAAGNGDAEAAGSGFKAADIESMYFIVSPRSILVSCTRDMNDHVRGRCCWLWGWERLRKAQDQPGKRVPNGGRKKGGVLVHG
eukprot:362452-Chlamydomonas_euryale.AAC.13